MMQKILLLLLLLSISIADFAGTRYYRASYRDDPAHTIVIAWCNDGASNNATVYYGKSDHGTNFADYEFSHTIDRTVSHNGLTHNFARLTNLDPKTIYYFVVKDDNSTSQRMSFKTLSDNPCDEVMFISGGDSRTGVPFFEFETDQCRPRRQKGNDLVAKIRPDFIAFTGDFVLTNGNQSQWEDWFTDWQRTIGPAATKGRIIPVVPVFGNHEETSDLYNMFDIPEQNNYFAINIGGNLLRLYNLNSDLECNSTQLSWFENDLNNYTGTAQEPYWKFVQYHVPLVPHGEYTPQTQIIDCWVSLFADHNVRLAMEGHSHIQKLTHPVVPDAAAGSNGGFHSRDDDNGVVYLGEGCWGAPLRDLYDYHSSDKAYEWTWGQGKFSGYNVIHVSKEKFEIRTAKIDNISGAGQVNENDPSGTLPSGIIWWDNNGEQVFTVSHPVTLNNNADATLLTVSNGSLTPAFSPSVFNYTVELPGGTSNVPSVSASLSDYCASYTIQNATNLTGTQAQRTTTVTVTAEDGTTENEYTIEFILVSTPDATLSNLTTSIGTLTPAFDPETFDYSVNLPFGTVQIPTVSATPNDPNATVNITQPIAVDGEANIEVTSEDQTETNTYTVNFVVASAGAKDILSFTIQGQISSEINENNQTITVSMPLSTDITDLSPVITYSGINLQPASNVSQDFTNPVSYVVTAADSSTKTYTASVELISDVTNANLDTLWTDAGDLSPLFDTTVLNYTVSIPNALSSVNIYAEPTDPNAIKKIYLPADIHANIAAQRTGNVLVIAPDNNTTKLYSILFEPAADINDISVQNFSKAYPNPTNNTITIECFKNPNKKWEIEIYNGLGILLNKYDVSANVLKQNVDLNKYSSGVYYIFVRTNDKLEYHKINKL